MAVSSEVKELWRAAEAQGWEVGIAQNNHIIFRPPEGKAIFGPSTPSDHRSWKNLRAKLRRSGLKV
jgi:hypothetical protein